MIRFVNVCAGAGRRGVGAAGVRVPPGGAGLSAERARRARGRAAQRPEGPPAARAGAAAATRQPGQSSLLLIIIVQRGIPHQFCGSMNARLRD